MVLVLQINCCGLVTKSCPTLATPWTVGLHSLLSMGLPRQILERVAVAFSRGPSQPGVGPESLASPAFGRWILHLLNHQGGLACCSPRRCKEPDVTEQLN